MHTATIAALWGANRGELPELASCRPSSQLMILSQGIRCRGTEQMIQHPPPASHAHACTSHARNIYTNTQTQTH